jgi:hypothetical protein
VIALVEAQFSPFAGLSGECFSKEVDAVLNRLRSTKLKDINYLIIIRILWHSSIYHGYLGIWGMAYRHCSWYSGVCSLTL